jgi:TPR repeat protein
MRTPLITALLCIAGLLLPRAHAQPTEALRRQFLETQTKAEQGDAHEQYKLGVFYSRGEGVEKDELAAFKWFRKAADQNLAPAQYTLGNYYHDGLTVEKDYAEAVRWYRKAIEQNHAGAQYNLGVCYRDGQGVPKDGPEAVHWFRKAADQNYAQAQYNLGVCYSLGQGVEQDLAEMLRWYRKSAGQHYAEAQSGLAGCYYGGRGVAQDFSEALKWFRQAAEQNWAGAQYNLGVCYYTGQGVAKDEVEAAKWFRKAAEQGDADAQLVLGLLHELGSGVLVDKAEAYTWYLRAAYQGNTFSQGKLGRRFMEAPNEPENRIDAYMWLSLADSGGDAEATPQKQRVAGKMSGTELAEAKRSVEEFSAGEPLASSNLPASGSAIGAIRTGSAAWGTNTDSAGYVTNVNLLKPFNVTKTFGRALTNAVLVNLRRGEATYKTPEGATGTLRLDLLPNEVLARLGCNPLTAQAFYLASLADQEEKKERTQQIVRQGQEAANAAALRRAARQRAMKNRRALYGRVIQKLDAGLLVSEGGTRDVQRQIILVKDYSKYAAVAADDWINFGTGFLVGQYSYTTVQQSKNTIHAYTCSTNAAVLYYLTH